MAELAASDGIRTVIATPHQLGGHAKLSGESIRAAAADFQRQLDARGIPLRVLPGGDVRIEPDLTRKIRTGEVVTLADRRRHVLLELPHDVFFPLERLLAELAAAGVGGVLSHPERNRGILRRPNVLRPLVERGCLLQLTAGSLTGTFGDEVQQLAESLIVERLVHVVATDAHSPRSRPPCLRRAFDRVADLADESVALNLFCRNPAAIAAGEAIPRACRPPKTKNSQRSWLSRTFSLERTAQGPIR